MKALFLELVLKITVVITSLLLAGCATWLERKAVESEFMRIYSCAPEKIENSFGRYTVEGCGYTAQMRCHSSRDAGLMDKHLLGETDCVLIRGISEARDSIKKVERLVVSTTPNGFEHIRLTLAPENHHWVIAGIPKQYPDRIAVYIGLDGRMSQVEEPCGVILVADGEEVPDIDSIVQDEDSIGVRFSLSLSSLKQIAGAERLVGQVCEQTIKVEGKDLELLKQFDLEFRERLVLPGAPGNKKDE